MITRYWDLSKMSATHQLGCWIGFRGYRWDANTLTALSLYGWWA